MSKTLSVEDLKVVDELSHLRTLDFINPVNDDLIAPYLKVFGFDLDYPIEYIACQHRTLSGKVVVSYLISGEVEINDSFLSSSFATTEDHMIAAGYRDLGVAEDIASAMTAGREYGGGDEGFPSDQANPDEKIILEQIKQLNDMLLVIRGNPFKKDGSRKTMAEQHLVEPVEKVRKKSVSRKKTA